MRFWDTSCIVSLLVSEPSSAFCRQALEEDTLMAVWWYTPTECISALMLRQREGLPISMITDALQGLDALTSRWMTINPSPLLASTARRLLRVHPLRAADALQLSASLTLAAGHPETLPFVCLDDRLREAASKEGFPVLPT